MNWIQKQIAISAVLLFLPAAESAAQSAAAPTHGPADDSIATTIVELINTNDAGARQAFVKARFDSAVPARDRRDIVALLQNLHDESGGVSLSAVEHVGRGTFVTVRAARQSRLALLRVAPRRENPSKLQLLEILKAWDPAVDAIRWPADALAGDAEVTEVIARNLDALSRAGAFSGAVLVGKGDSIIFERAYGYANLEDSVPNTIGTKFTIASMGKLFTATAVAQLISQGRLHWDDTLGAVLPEYPNAERARSITIRELLGHTAGLGTLFGDSALDRNRDYSSALEMASAVAYHPLLFAPGAGWAYSNEGFVVLGAIVAKVSGESFDDYLARHVYAPAGMTQTGNWGADETVLHRAVGYRHRESDPLAVQAPYGNRTFVRKGSPAGGEYSTLGDLWRFTRALRAGTLVPAAVRDTLWVGRSPLPWDKTQQYGYGAIVSQVNGRTVIGHGGGGGGSGIDNELCFFRDGAYTVIVIANEDPPAAADLGKALIEFLSHQQKDATGRK